MKLFIALCLLLLNFSPVFSAGSHPLRPFPKEPPGTISDEFQTPYCAQRPTSVQSNKFDKRDKTITLTVQGTQTANFTEFVTPLLSITDSEKPDYNLNFDQKAQRYLADYLEGRAFYEPLEEPTNPTIEQQSDLLARSGVFRKLAPSTYQDKLKRILIKRGHGDYSNLDELEKIYGFRPASVFVHATTPVQNLTLSDFYNHWAPIPEDFNTWEDYETAYGNWTGCDSDGENCSQWFNLWPYVPMFTREDAPGYIITHDEPRQFSNPTQTLVYHPHLARTYEVSSTLSNMLSPSERHTLPKDPDLPSQWITPAPWTTDVFWIESGQNQPSSYGPVCDPQNNLIYSSGDLALDSSIQTQLNSLLLDKKLIEIDNPQYDPNCEIITTDPETGETIIDDSNCYYDQAVRFSPTSLETKTPYLHHIMDRLSTGPTALFNIFQNAIELEADPPQNWPGVGYEDEERPEYSFSGGSAEAGNKNPGKPATFYYKYLGFIQCQKEKILERLLPAGIYQPFATECTQFIKEDRKDKDSQDMLAGDICAIAKKYNFDCDILKAIQLIETGLDPYNNPNLRPLSGTPLQYCNSQGYCGPFAVGAGLQVSLDIPLHKFETIEGNAEAAIRHMQMRMCQADGGCMNSKWTPDLQNKYSLNSGEYEKAAYYHYGTDLPDTDSQKRWGEGQSYADAIEYVVKNGELP